MGTGGFWGSQSVGSARPGLLAGPAGEVRQSQVVVASAATLDVYISQGRLLQKATSARDVAEDRMMARLYRVVVTLLLLAEVSGFEEGATNPGFVARITRKGLEYARRFGVAILKKELSTIKLPDFSGSFKVGWIKSVSYDFYRLTIHCFELRNSDLRLRPRQGVRASLSNNYMFVSGNWKVKKAFVTLDGTFDVNVDGISISVSLKLGKDQSGRPTASVAHCRNSIGHISVDISGQLSWILNLFHERIENNFKNILEQKNRNNDGIYPAGLLGGLYDIIHTGTDECLIQRKGRVNGICEMVRKSTTSHLEPYLRTLPVISMIDQVAGIDYSLVDAPEVTSQVLDTPFKGEFFGQNWHSPAPFDAPPKKHDHMVYFAVSEYVFNTASWVYHQAGHMNFTIQNHHIPLDSPIHLHTSSFRAIIPQLARLYPNMELELETSPESAPFLMFTPGSVTLMPVIDIQAFAVLPTSSDRKPLFQLRVTTNISATISVNSDRIAGSVTTGSKLKLELKHSNIRFINVELMEAILNYYALHTLYASLNAKLEEGFPLPLPRDTHLNSLELQVHEEQKRDNVSLKPCVAASLVRNIYRDGSRDRPAAI
ncbi:PREDICTED: lipopolysaccharide-binding protein-like [Odobenus rosmarus divergens]|uniref:Bactericidal permeability-increasing protein n=1 Tax=Odobenus rosmarus divergens TaxID=9708 RepID=A0A9B0HBW1_ODORO